MEKINRQNPNCNHNKCMSPNGEVRILPIISGKSNAIYCITCFNHEMKWRKERNRILPDYDQFPIPKWEDLEVYTV